jgi:hypothetical protein
MIAWIPPVLTKGIWKVNLYLSEGMATFSPKIAPSGYLLMRFI